MATSPKLKKCQGCKHHVSAHQYEPEKVWPDGRDPQRQGPQKCTVPGCECKEFIRWALPSYIPTPQRVARDNALGDLFMAKANNFFKDAPWNKKGWK